MQSVDHDKFIFIFQQADFGTFQPAHMSGLGALLGFLEADAEITDPRQAAYMLATAMHETALTFLPIAEYGKGSGKKYGLPAANGQVFYGRGYVQLTWAENYQAMGQALGIDLYGNPDLAMNPDTAYAIISRGMRKGSFTGVSLSRFITGDQCDFLNARKIINGLDCADKIAGYAAKILDALNQAQTIPA